MAWLEDLGKTIGHVAQGINDAAQTVADAAQDTMEQVKQQREQERQQKKQQNTEKCPNCGHPLSGIAAVCPLCGFEFRSVDSEGSIENFVKDLNELERKRSAVFDSISQALSKRKANPTDEKIATLIRNYVIPNTKEDIIEFMLLASNNINGKVFVRGARTSYNSGNGVSEVVQAAWVSKFEQAYNKAKISFGDDPDFKKVEELYCSKVKIVSEEKPKSFFERLWF